MRSQILLVDDDILVLRSFQRSLNDTFDADIALNPYEAISKLSQDPNIRVVVTDIDMPGMNGVNFLKRIQSQWPDMPCIVLTGDQDPALADTLRALPNVMKVFLKPTPSQDVLQAIRIHLDSLAGADVRG